MIALWISTIVIIVLTIILVIVHDFSKKVAEDTKQPKFRVGTKQGSAILYIDSGQVYLLFPKGEEQAAKEYCDYLNKKK